MRHFKEFAVTDEPIKHHVSVFGLQITRNYDKRIVMITMEKKIKELAEVSRIT